MADHKEMAISLRNLAVGTVEWRVTDPETGSYCIAFDNEREADEWLADHKQRHPGSMHANKVVQRTHWLTRLERAALRAADMLDNPAPESVEATAAPTPTAPRFLCNKCGYSGPVQVRHQRPNGSGECDYMAVRVREIAAPGAEAAAGGVGASAEFEEFAAFVMKHNKEQPVPWPIAELFVRSYRAMLDAAPSAPGMAGDVPSEPSRPDILERLTYHALERDDLTLDQCLSFLAKGWREVHGRDERALVLQILALLAATPVNPSKEAPGEPSYPAIRTNEQLVPGQWYWCRVKGAESKQYFPQEVRTISGIKYVNFSGMRMWCDPTNDQFLDLYEARGPIQPPALPASQAAESGMGDGNG